MKTTYSLLFNLILALTLRTALAGENGSAVRDDRLSLDQVTSVVLANNPAIKEAENRWRAANERVGQVSAWDDPRIGGESRVHRFVEVPPNAFMDQSLTVEQLIPITGKNLVRA